MTQHLVPYGRTRRALFAAIMLGVATLFAGVGGVAVSIATRDRPPVPTQAATTASGDSGTGATGTAAGAPPPTPAPSRAAPAAARLPAGSAAFEFAGAGESRYSSDYWAEVTGGRLSSDVTVDVSFSATGRSDLRRPETSCLMHRATDSVARPIAFEPSTEQPGRYVGVLRFPLLLDGTWDFLYSCRTDYSLTPLGDATTGAIGTGAFSTNYYATVLSAAIDGELVTIDVAAHGRADLRRPETSCVRRGGTGASVGVTYLVDSPTFYVASLEFEALGTPFEFVYSCSGYSPVAISDQEIGGNLVSSETTPATVAATTSTSAVATPTVAAAPPVESRTVREPIDLTVLAQSGTSRYSDAYYAAVTAVDVADDHLVRVSFDATGRSDLRRPGSSCLRNESTGAIARPVGLDLAVDEAGRYRGVMTFPVLQGGEWSFQYSCQSDYTSVPVVRAVVSQAALSRYSERYYVLVREYRRAPDTLEVDFIAHGSADLRRPSSSCVSDGTRSIAASRTDLSVEQAGYYVGTLVFDVDASVARYSFVYSCQRDYTSVSLG